MKYKVRIMDSAKAEIREIYWYIAETLKNPSAAECRVSLIEESIRSLGENPARHPLVADEYLASKGWTAVVMTHLIFFIVREKERAVSVMRVLYGRRDWLRILRMEAGQSEQT